MTSRDRVLATLSHTQPDRVPVDFGSTPVTGIHVSCVAALRDHFGLNRHPVKVIEPYQMLGEIEEDLASVLGIDVAGIMPRKTMFGFPNERWKAWRMYDGLDVMVPGDFNVTIDDNGDTLIYPEGDTSVSPSGRMPKDGYFFDAIIRQEPINEANLSVDDNTEEFTPVSSQDLDYFASAARIARATGRAVVANFGGTGLGDIALVPGPWMKHPRGIRDVAEWYMATSARREYVHAVFDRQTAVAIENLRRIRSAVEHNVDILYLCGTDFGTQTSSFCSEKSFRDLWFPYYKRLCDWVHTNTPWKIFKHSCGSVERFVPAFIEAGIDILNPVQCSAAGMAAQQLKSKYGRRLTFWGGGIDTQKLLPFGAPAEVRDQVLRRCEVFAAGGGFVFNTIHNIQARTPVANIVAMLDAVADFNRARTASAR
jgi:uroporphyrinogen-III decarboxylase